MHYFIFLVDESSVQFAPKRHLLHHFRDGLFFLLRLPVLRFKFVVFGPLLLFEQLETASHLFPEAQFEVRFVIGVAERGLVYLFPVLFLGDEVVFVEGGCNDEAEDVYLASFVVVAD